MSKTKNALLFSVLSIVVCLTMLIGSTFAWFTDSAKTGTNVITAGNLDLKLEYSTDASAWSEVTESTTDIFEDVLWEPGRTEVVYFKVTNMGDLSFKYDIGTNIVKEIGAKNLAGDDFKLSEKLLFGIVSDIDGAYSDRATARKAVTDPKKFSAIVNSANTIEKKGDSEMFAMVVWMDENINNEANYRGSAPEIQFGIHVLATQQMAEQDSFGNDYDENAKNNETPKYDEIEAKPGTQKELHDILTTALTGGKGTVTITLDKDFTIDNTWETPKMSNYAGTNTVVINGNNHKITNLNAPLLEGSFAGSGSITINDLTIEKANIKEESTNGLGVGSFLSYSNASGSVTFNNCHVLDSYVECTDERAGAFIGYSDSVNTSFINCSVDGSEIVALKGSAGAFFGQSGNSAGTVTITNPVVTNTEITGEKAAKTGLIGGSLNYGIFKVTADGTKFTGNKLGNATDALAENNTTVFGRFVYGEGSKLTFNSTEYTAYTEVIAF